VNWNRDSSAGPMVQGVEFRSAPRYRVLQRCFIRPPGLSGADGWRGIAFSMSATGIGVTLPLPVERGTEIEVEPWNLRGAPTVTARVVHICRLDFVWLTGCQLSRRLTDDELAAWLTNATAGV
jgi:hypothetical protein